MRTPCLLALAMVFIWGGFSSEAQEPGEAAAKPDPAAALEADVTQGALRVVGEDGAILECPLKHTAVEAEISGFIARVRVTQTFVNPREENIEAVYVFPLPHEGAIDDMTMVIGKRKIVGEIKRRAEAERIYQEALSAGLTAALLEQERPNIFTQKVGNILPGQEVKIEITYVDVLRYDLGEYEFSFPMVVGPRYNPGNAVNRPEPAGEGVSPRAPDTEQVPDGSKINPPILLPGVRNGHDISLSVQLDAGVPIGDLKVAQHQAAVVLEGDRRARVTLSPHDSIPNKDFVLRYKVVGEKPQTALLTHTGEHSKDAGRLGTGYFLLMVQPAEDERLTKSPPRELVFLVDVSGSMRGEPMAKAQEAMRGMLGLCREQDTFQVVTFASRSNALFEKPVPATEANIRRANALLEEQRGGGGTEMLRGVQMAIDQPLDDERLRIVVMLTDGYIGNEAQIIEHVGKHCGDQIRFWAIGVGSSPNMFLIDGVAKQGGGMGKHLAPQDEAGPLTQEIMTRIQRAQLAKVEIDWGGLEVCETYPARIPELWAGRPIVLFGRYRSGGKGEIAVRGQVEGEGAEWKLAVELPADEPANPQLAKVWARRKMEDLMQQAYYGASPPIEEEVTALALDYRLMSQYTSFVAVDQETARMSDEPVVPPRRMAIPVPLPAGTVWEGFFGEAREFAYDAARWREAAARPLAAAAPALRVAGPALGDHFNGKPGGQQLVQQMRGLQAGLQPGRPMRAGNGLAAGEGWGAGLGGGGVAEKRKASLGLPFNFRRQSVDMLQRGRLGQDRAGIQIPSPVEPLGTVASRAENLLKEVDERGKAEGTWGFAHQGFTTGSLQGGVARWRQAAAEALEKARELAAGENASQQAAVIERLLERAVLLDTCAAGLGMGEGILARQALEEMEKRHEERVAGWKKEFPAIARRLDLVIRDASLTEALEQLAAAAGLQVQLTPESAADAASLLGTEEARVSYLDLRHATAAQGLDWLVRPCRLQWSVTADGAVRVTSTRRNGGEFHWIYDVARLALPAAEELKNLDYAKSVEAAGREAEAFRSAVAAHAGLADEGEVLWFAPGRLLVRGEEAAHRKVAQLLEKLESAEPRLEEEPLAKLQERTSRRAAARKELEGAVKRAGQVLETLAAHEHFGWQLLAGAVDGRLDLEALTELQVAWRAPQTETILADAPSLALRSWWCVAEAARLLPEEQELARFSEGLAPRGREVLEKSLAALEQDPADESHRGALLYGALALRNDAAVVARALPRLTETGDQPDSLRAQTALLSRALLGPASAELTDQLSALVREGVYGDDAAALTAWACYRAGGSGWTNFRRESRDLLGKQPLSGNVLLFVNRLEGSPLR